ncbi:Epimerase family protein [bacterium HR17]|uniref:Epimerase family protein n=1 Tax=Candidatus Fervidibacter japonicus TaxID=2035412 RepID=A0A2H5XCI4_9BACT|nr:Epimerase family protein [bacterium HR17]
MRVVLVGGTGFIGQAVLTRLHDTFGRDLALIFITRHQDKANQLPAWIYPAVWDTMEAPPSPRWLDGADAVINLAGETVAQRWTAAAKQRIRDSRVLTTRHLVEAMRQTAKPPKVLINASATGYYGDRGDEELTESSPPGTGFLAEVCQLWEEEAQRATELGVRVVCVRFGVVLGVGGGALERILPFFEWGIGGRLGSGQQWMAWVHRQDAARLIVHALTTETVRGPINAVAPNPVRNREFTRSLARAVGKPALFPVPTFALRALYGEMADILLHSQRALPQAALAAGFQFEHPDIEEALRHILYWRRRAQEAPAIAYAVA